MKKILLLAVVASAVAWAEPAFPGLRVIMSPEEFARAGLDRLTPDQLGVIDAAVIKHYHRTINASVAQAAADQNLPPPSAPLPTAGPVATTANAAASAAEQKRGWLARFGIGKNSPLATPEESLHARCTGWATGNSFRLDNGQVWEGTEPIPFEVAGRDVTIEPRPGGHYALVVDGKNTTVRVRRIK